MSKIRCLEPKNIWNYFEDINEIPRGSKKEEKISQYMVEFGKKLGLETHVDKTKNVIIKKPATRGMENKKTVILQSHLDMVHQKNNDTKFDFDKEGIKSYIDGDWVKAEGTTLGADNGIGVATMMNILASDNIEHPNIECLFTIDEETGMTGAKELEGGKLEGSILLNLDTEDDREITIGCAGGVDTTISKHYKEENAPDIKSFKISVKGLKGGHSGMDIHLGRGNSNKILARILFSLESFGLRISEINGGGLRNAIPREAEAIVYIDKIENFKKAFKTLSEDIKSELSTTEPNLKITLDEITHSGKVMSEREQKQIVNSLMSCFNGVYRMSADVEGLVETSSNMAQVSAKEGKFEVRFLSRSAIDSAKMDCVNSIRASFENIDCKVEISGEYPGWKPDPNSEILEVMKNLYIKKFDDNPIVMACHAGLECGIISGHYRGLDMISFGPTIQNPHSPDERVNIKSVQKFWEFLKEILKNIPSR